MPGPFSARMPSIQAGVASHSQWDTSPTRWLRQSVAGTRIIHPCNQYSVGLVHGVKVYGAPKDYLPGEEIGEGLMASSLTGPGD